MKRSEYLVGRLLFLNPHWKLVRAPKSRRHQSPWTVEGEQVSSRGAKQLVEHGLVDEILRNDEGWLHYTISAKGLYILDGPPPRRKTKRNRDPRLESATSDMVARDLLPSLTKGERRILRVAIGIDDAPGLPIAPYDPFEEAELQIWTVNRGGKHYRVHGSVLNRLEARSAIRQVEEGYYVLTDLGVTLGRILNAWGGKTKDPRKKLERGRVTKLWHRKNDRHIRRLNQEGATPSSIAELKGVAPSTIRRILRK